MSVPARLQASVRANLRTIRDPVVAENPITVQSLGLCSALAVTSSLLPSLVMSIAVIAVLTLSNVIISLLRHVLPHSIRLILEMTVIASAVTIVDQILKAFAPNISSILSVFVGLIITNCMVLARVESFAMHNNVYRSLLDGLGNGFGYTWVLLVVGAIRELLGSGTLLGYRVLVPLTEAGGWFRPNELMLLTPSAFFIIGLLIWLVGSWRGLGQPRASDDDKARSARGIGRG